jgi:hypothetical protein
LRLMTSNTWLLLLEAAHRMAEERIAAGERSPDPNQIADGVVDAFAEIVAGVEEYRKPLAREIWQYLSKRQSRS